MPEIDAGALTVSYRDVGPPDGPAVVLLHGFPYDVHCYDAVAEHLASAGRRCIVPYLRGYGPTRFRNPATMRSGEQAALGSDLRALMDSLGLQTATLAGFDWGGRAACIVAALWPNRVRGLVSCGSGYNIQNIAAAIEPADPAQEHRYWYQYYFHTTRGRVGLARNRAALCRLLWRLWSPGWAFDDSTYARTAASFENPDFVDVVIHSYRHRFGGVAGDPDCAAIEAHLAAQPPITVPAAVLQGLDDGVDPPSDRDVGRFRGPFALRRLPGVGHNPPQEAPASFAEAVLSLG